MNSTENKKNDISQKDTIVEVLHYIRRYWVFLAFSLVLAVLTVVLTLYVPILIGQAIDRIVEAGRVDFAGIRSILIRIAIAVLLTGISQWLMNMMNNHITYHVVHDIREEAFEKLEILPLSYLDSHAYGEIVSRVIADVDQFADGLLMGFTQFFTGVVTIAGTLFFMVSIHLSIALIVVVLTPLSFVIAGFVARNTYNMFRMQSVTRGEQTGLIDEMIGNEKVVQAFGYGDRAMERFDA